jgi:hypothetical protein
MGRSFPRGPLVLSCPKLRSSFRTAGVGVPACASSPARIP